MVGAEDTCCGAAACLFEYSVGGSCFSSELVSAVLFSDGAFVTSSPALEAVVEEVSCAAGDEGS